MWIIWMQHTLKGGQMKVQQTMLFLTAINALVKNWLEDAQVPLIFL